MEFFGFIPLVAFVIMIGSSLLFAAMSQSYAQSDKRAQQETIFLNDILVDDDSIQHQDFDHSLILVKFRFEWCLLLGLYERCLSSAG